MSRIKTPVSMLIINSQTAILRSCHSRKPSYKSYCTIHSSSSSHRRNRILRIHYSSSTCIKNYIPTNKIPIPVKFYSTLQWFFNQDFFFFMCRILLWKFHCGRYSEIQNYGMMQKLLNRKDSLLMENSSNTHIICHSD